MEDPEAMCNHNSYLPYLPVKKETLLKSSFSRLCFCISSVLVPALIALITSFMAYKHLEGIYRRDCQSGLDPIAHRMPTAERQIGRGIPKLPWETDEIGATGVTLTDEFNFHIIQPGLYEIYSKITFEFTAHNKTQLAYHNLNLISNHGNSSVLEKNVITVPDTRLRQRRSFETSDLFLLRRLQTGDVISVVVSDTSLVYHSKIDNTVKIIKRA